jgi:GNAT superfamily N-acetyltransferase
MKYGIEPAIDADMEECMSILMGSFDAQTMELMTIPATQDKCALLAQQHIQCCHEHTRDYPAHPVAIKCIWINPVTGKREIVGFAEWFIYDRTQRSEDFMRPLYLHRFEWVLHDDARQHLLSTMEPLVAARQHIMGGKAHGFLINLCVHKNHRRQGIASRLTTWGMQICSDLRIPAYLHASPEGKRLYETLGWETPECVQTGEVRAPAMIWDSEKVKEGVSLLQGSMEISWESSSH